MSGRHRVIVALCAASVVVALAAVWPRRQPPPQKPGPDVGASGLEIHGSKAADAASKGRSTETPLVNGSLDESEDPALEALVGRTPRIPIDANPMVKSVVEAYRANTHPERLSVSVIPAPFDAAQYANDPDKYLSVVEPGRVWQSAQPGSDVTPIEVASKRVFSVPQRETTSLKVKATPKAPVTFTSLDLGEFQNRLTSITVAADDDGIAVARFTGTPGTYGDVDILAASPLTSGQLHFVVTVHVPGFNAPGTNETTR